MNINNQLEILYRAELNNLENSSMSTFDLDGPLLMHSWESEFTKSKYKMLFYGRESNGWYGDLNFNFDECIKRYADFELCENGTYTTFWQYIYNTKNILMPESVGQKNFLWSNVSKFSKLDGTAISRKYFDLICTNFNIMEREIEIVKPDVVIFFSGNSWDEKIQTQISDGIIFEQLIDSVAKEELSRLVSNKLPYHTYRVPHPITMQLQKKWNYMESIITSIQNRN